MSAPTNPTYEKLRSKSTNVLAVSVKELSNAARVLLLR
jgi:hypothetical protein